MNGAAWFVVGMMAMHFVLATWSRIQDDNRRHQQNLLWETRYRQDN